MAGTPTFATRPSFMGIPWGEGAATVIAGVPLDIGTTNRAGARSGPAAIRAASRMLVDGDHPTARIDPVAGGLAGGAAGGPASGVASGVADAGEFAIALGDIAASLALIEQQAARQGHLVALGGEHGITLALLRALRRRLGAPLGLVVFDAHVDTWPDNFGQALGHGSVFFHAINEGLVDPARMVQVGIRSPVQRDVMDWTLAQGVTVIDAMAVHEAGPAAIAGRIRDVVGAAPCYLSFDIDALDPAFAPGTGTPEIGGLATWQAQAIMRRLGGLDFVGMDVVEVAPAFDVAEITALAAATMAWEYLTLHAMRCG